METIPASVVAAVSSLDEASAMDAIQQILISDDPAGTLAKVLTEFANVLPSSILAVYRVGQRRSANETLGLRLDEDLTPNSGHDPFGTTALDTWAEMLGADEPVLVSVDALPAEERHRVERAGCRSIMAVPVRPGHDLAALLICISKADIDDWTDDDRLRCRLSSNAIGVAVARQESVRYNRLVAVLQYSFDIVSVLDADGKITFYTPSLARVLGTPDENLIGRSALTLAHPQDQTHVAETLQTLVDEPGGQRRMEVRLKHADGSWHDFEALGTNQIENPLIGGIVVTAYDITERKNLEQRLNWQALHDPLTKLANRVLLMNDLRHALARTERSGGLVGVLFIDLDRFKRINDQFGHPAGDQLLIRVGERLRACVRAGETVARLGGDEFVALLEGLESVTDVESAATRILDTVRMPVRLGDDSVTITASMGIAIASGEAIEPDELLIRADNALYAAKRAGRARYHFFGLDGSRHQHQSMINQSGPNSDID